MKRPLLIVGACAAAIALALYWFQSPHPDVPQSATPTNQDVQSAIHGTPTGSVSKPERQPVGEAIITVYCGRSHAPLPNVAILRHPSGNYRYFAPQNYEVLSFTDELGQSRITAEFWRPQTAVWACKKGYLSGAISERSLDRDRPASITLQAAMQVQVTCAYEDGVPVDNACVAISQVPMGNWMTADDAPSAADPIPTYSGEVSESAIWSGRTNAAGILSIDLPRPGKYLLHAEHLYAVALHDGERDAGVLLSDGSSIALRFRKLLAAGLRCSESPIVAFSARVPEGIVERRDPDAIFAVAAANRRLRQQHRDCAVVAFLPQQNASPVGPVAFRAVTVAGARVAKDCNAMELQRLVLDELTADVPNDAGTTTVVVKDRHGDEWRDVPINFSMKKDAIVITGMSGKPSNLPSGSWICAPMGRTWFGARVYVSVETLANHKCSAEINMDRYVRCVWDVHWPYAGYGSRLALVVTNTVTKERRQIANWDPARETETWLVPGTYTVVATAAGIASKEKAVTVPERAALNAEFFQIQLDLERVL